jgi:GNAT superfamily N-acetyltransferase
MITVSANKAQLDLLFIQHFLKDIYWTAPRSLEEVQAVIDHSFCFGIYDNDQQIGFARVITDYVVFAYVMDVFIDEQHRGKGYSSILIDAMLHEPQLQQVKIWRLATKDAQPVYEKFGFKLLAHPERMMERIVS